MIKMKKRILALILAAITISACMYGCEKKVDNEANETKVTQKSDTKKTKSGKKVQKPDKKEEDTVEVVTEDENNTYTPTLMYFVSEKDEKFDEEMKLITELEKEYESKINFDIHNIDKTPEDKKNFPVEDTTPVLIMLDSSNNISALEFLCLDKETIINEIEKAMSKE